MADVNSRYNWVSSGQGQILPHAIPGGVSCNGEMLFIGRIRHQGHLICGKIQPSHGCLYVAYGGKEHCYKNGYEVLVNENSGQPIASPNVSSQAKPKKPCFFCEKPPPNPDCFHCKRR